MCACGRYKDAHEWPSGTIAAEEGVEGCGGFTEVSFEESGLGKALADFFSGAGS
jgi:hypothetical protein